MKRRKYDDKVYSARHIRRLAKKQTDEDLRNIAAAIETSVSLPSHVTSEPQTSSTDKTIECKQSSKKTIKQDSTVDETTKDKSPVKMHAICKVPVSDISTEIEVNYHTVQYSIDVKDTEINAINEECDDHPMNTSEKINDNIGCSLSCNDSDDLSRESCDDEIENLNHAQKFVNMNDCEGNIKTEEKILKYLQEIKEAQKILLQRLNRIDCSVSNLQRKIKNFKSNRIQSEASSTDLFDDGRMFVESFFPVDNEEKKMEVTEAALLKKKNALALITFIKSIGGKNARDGIITILSRLVTDRVLVEYSYKGQGKSKITNRPNKCFKDLMICKCIYEAVKKKYNGVNEEIMKESVSSWLDSAGTRLRKKSRSSSTSKGFKPLELSALYDSDTDVK